LPPAGSESYRLVTVDGRTHVCSERDVDDGGAAHHACWHVDLASGDVRRSDIVVEPGRGRMVPATWTADGLCADGYCVPGTNADADDDDAEARVELAIGENVAVMLAMGDLHFFDGARRPKTPPPSADRDDGPSASASDPMIVGDVVFVGDYDAGPHADVHVYGTDGRYLGPVTDPADTDEYSGDFELWNGSISVLGDHEVAFAEHLLQRVLIFDTRAKKVTKVWHRQSELPETCTSEMKEIYFDPVEANLEFALEDGKVTPVCKASLDSAEGRFGPYGMARDARGDLVALARTGETLVLVTLDNDGDVARDVPLATCEPPP
jgi:hypothetical protein